MIGMQQRPSGQRSTRVRLGNRVYALNIVTLDREQDLLQGDFPAGLCEVIRRVGDRLDFFGSRDRCLHKHPESARNRPCVARSMREPWRGEMPQETYLGDEYPVLCPEKVLVSKGLLLGKGDLCLFTSSSDEIWGAHARAAVHSIKGISEVLPVPFLRLVYGHRRIEGVVPANSHCLMEGGSGRACGGVQRDLSMFSEQERLPAIVCFTSIRLREHQEEAGSAPVEGSGSPTPRGPSSVLERALERQHAAPGAIRAAAALIGELQQDPLFSGADLEGYLTFNDYQVMLKFGAESYTRACDLLREVRLRGARTFLSTSTQICLPFHRPEDIIGDWGSQVGEAGLIAQRERRERRQRDLAADPSPTYVGLLLRVETAPTRSTFDPVGREILDLLVSEGFVENRAALQLERHGYWDLHFTFRCVDLVALVQLVIHRISAIDGVLGTRVVPYLEADAGPSGELDLVPWGDFDPGAPGAVDERIEKWDPWDRMTPESVLKGSMLLRKQHDLEAHLGWISTRIAQFCEAWDAHRSLLPQNVSIWRVQQMVGAARKALQGQLEPGFVEDRLARMVRQHEAIAMLEGLLPDYEALVGFYNERLEAAHVAAVVEPFPRAGERAGALTMVMAAINRLMTDCCGQAKDDAPFRDRLYKPGTDGEQRLASRAVARGWHGLCTTTAGKDFEVNADTQILMVPAVTKLSARGILLSLPHEAAHFIIESILARGAARDFRRDALQGCWDRVHSAVSRHLADAVLEGELGQVVLQEVASERYRYQLAEEILADLLGYLIGGPAFAVGFDSYRYTPLSFEEGVWSALPAICRVSMGQMLAESGRWDTDYDQAAAESPEPSFREQTWRGLVHRVYREMVDEENEALGLVGNLEQHTARELNIDTGAIELWPQLQRVSESILDAIEELLCCGPGEEDTVSQLEDILSSCFEDRHNPLFFHGEHSDPTKQLAHVLDIRDRMLQGWELVLDARPRDLIAAGTFIHRSGQLDRRNNFPTLRLYMSLLYTQEEAKPH